jgi:hypothetical protein
VSWDEVEDRCACKTGTENRDVPNQCLAAMRERRRDDLRAAMRVWLLTTAVSLMLMLEDDVAMIAFMFC